MNIDDKIDSFFKEMYKLDKEKFIKEKEISARDLIVSERIDLVAKIKYIESIENKYNTNFFTNLYKESINCFSDGTYKEPGNKSKCNFNEYIDTFDNLIDDIKKNGFDNKKSIVPISKDSIILDGSHRTAICAYYNKKIKAASFDVIGKKYDLDYFQKKCMIQKYRDYLCLEYSKMKDNIYAICVWPRCPKDYYEEIDKEIKSNFKVIYKKEISFTYKGLRNFLIQIYNNDSWIGSIDDNYKGIDFKLNNCFGDNNTYFYVIEEKDIKKLNSFKTRIREKVGIGNHSMHTSDNKSESIKILNMILNNNTINFLNNADIYKYKDKIKELNELKKKFVKNKINSNKLVLDGSIVLTLYGLRVNRDIDVIVSDDELKNVEKIIDVHNDELKLYNKTVDDIIYNPDSYFYFDDLKFISLELLKYKKEKRGEKKDKKDIDLINTVLVKNSFFKKSILGFKVFMIKSKLRIKHHIMKFLKVTKLEKPFKKVWRIIKGKRK